MSLFKKYYVLIENQNFLFENVYGNKAIVYHRTNKKELIDNIFEQGYLPKKGFDPTRRNSYSDIYGVGFYASYESKSQFNDYMKYQFGPIVVKFIINSLNNFLFVDFQEFIKNELSKKIKWTPETFIEDQMKYYGFDKIIPFENLNLIFPYNQMFSSDFVRQLVNNYGVSINKIIDGVIFTDPRQGKILVSYNTNIIVPVSFTIDEGNTWNKIKKDKKYLEKIFSQSINKKNVTLDKLKKDHWIYKANISEDASFEINIINNEITWHGGTWYSGTWEGGTWQGGTWEYGVWKDGTFENGTWEDGVWEDGNFLKDAIWWKGIWKLGFFYGTWKDGTWKDGIFSGKRWFRGIWEKGTWEKGTWEKGTWERGIWLGGEWISGKDKNNQVHDEGDSPDKWNTE